MKERQAIINRIFAAQGNNGCWKMLSKSDQRYPVYLHYIPNYKATLWTLILLADIQIERDDPRVRKPLSIIRKHFFDPITQIYSLKDDHFPIPCLNGNIIYLDSYFGSGALSQESLAAVDFFSRYQRFDDGEYSTPKNTFCSNKSCYGKHTCYWGVVKIFKGLSHIREDIRTDSAKLLLENCIRFVLLHSVCFSSRDKSRLMINKIDKLTFPCMYKGDFLETLWLLARENVKSDNVKQAVELLESKRMTNGCWNLERRVNNMVTAVGEINEPNPFITQRASAVMDYYND